MFVNISFSQGIFFSKMGAFVAYSTICNRQSVKNTDNKVAVQRSAPSKAKKNLSNPCWKGNVSTVKFADRREEKGWRVEEIEDHAGSLTPNTLNT
jgi:hypothetical protein